MRTPTAAAGEALLAAYASVKDLALACLAERLPRPDGMKPEPLPAQPRRARLRRGPLPALLGRAHQRRPGHQHSHAGKADPPPARLPNTPNCADLGDEIAQACAAEPDCCWDPDLPSEPLAPTLARHAEPDDYAARARTGLECWAQQNLPAPAADRACRAWICCGPTTPPADIVATLLYPVTDRPFRELYQIARGWSERRRAEVIDVALGSGAPRATRSWLASAAACTPTTW